MAQLNKDQFSFLNAQNLSDENLSILQKTFSNPEDLKVIKPYMQFDLQSIIENRKLKKENVKLIDENKQLKVANAKLLSKNEIYHNELSLIRPILCKLKKESFLSIQPNSNMFKIALLPSVEPLKEPALISLLNQEEERLYIVSQSSNDIFNVINPKSNDYFSIYENYFICFELPEKVNICGFKVFSAGYDFPKTFNIEIDGVVVKEVKEANELNGENKEMTININPKEGKLVKLILTGPQWDDNKSNSIHICLKRFEILSNDQKYANGVFETLVKSCEYQDPHRCSVLLSATKYDFNSFHSIDNKNQICTWTTVEKSWFQIELTKGLAVISHCRIIMHSDDLFLKSFKIVGSADRNIPVHEWKEIFSIENNDHKSSDIYEFPEPSPPIKFVRLIVIEVKNPKRNYLAFDHLDFFGYYFSN